MESLSKPELLMLFSILEGELEARDLVIDALKAQRKDLYIQERYGRYNLSDPFLALQRDGEAVGGPSKETASSSSSTSNPLVVLKLVVSHCRRMQEKMLAQLAAAESRHRRVIADLEEEKRRHAEDTAEGDDVTYILEKERERLQQQLEFERCQVRRLEKEQRRAAEQLEEERAQHKQLSCALAKECKWASARALEEGHRVTELNRKLDKEKEASQALRKELEEERRRALRMEARVEEQLAEFDTEREQLRSRLKKEEAHCCQLQQQVEELRRTLDAANAEGGGGARQEQKVPAEAWRKEEALTRRVPLAKTRADTVQSEDIEEEGRLLNGHHCPAQTNGHHRPDDVLSEKPRVETGDDDDVVDPVPAHAASSLSPGGTDASSSLGPSPCASPVPGGQSPGSSPVPAGYQSSYQAGINQRFHAARHKFQGTADPEPQPQSQSQPQPQPQSQPQPQAQLQPQPQPQPQASQPASSPQSSKEPSPSPSPAPDASPVKQLARSTVTQVLSRFTTVQQSVAAKLPAVAPNNSPFGTDYRSLAAPLSPVIARASGVLPQGVRSPTIPRADRGNPPPIPPKKPGLAQAPASPAPVPRSPGHFSDGPLSASCGLTSSQEGVKELDMVVSSN